MQIHFLNFERKTLIWLKNSTQITGIAFFRTKDRFQGPLEGEGVEMGTLKYLPGTYFIL